MIEEGFKRNDVAIAPLVYLVDDDEDFREEMVLGLSSLGLNVHGFDGAASLYRAYAARPSDIVILDIGLDGEDGLSIAAHLRASQSVGIVMATARGSIDDRVGGLRTGADAYLVKPIDVRELAATVVALNNRLNRLGIPSPPPTPGWALVEGGWVLTDGMGRRLRLTAAEQRLLGRLFIEHGKTVERRALVEALGEDIYDFNYAHLDTIVSRLRRRAEKSDMVLPLHAIRGKGFAFAG
ncbi:response regulator transcription factor [Vineibacter terrae]|uniref:response regulator transcription factor n=1 Tax=Vineibacter terrae TaxID=2586908 RepID=UPI002E31A2D7|nr:response regulator transcription factor [Vineibacter terrae]HEX2885148.1 response regulator transcription factor [Vineibacter terrae]